MKNIKSSQLPALRSRLIGLLLAVLAAGCVMALLPAAAGAAPSGLGVLVPLATVPGNIKAVDLNGDGRPDIVAPEFGAAFLAVRINDGQGGFGPVRRYPVGLLPSFVASGDFNRDGHVDIAVSNTLSGDISVLLGNGDGTLQPAHSYPVSAPGLLGLSTGSFSVDAMDVNADGILDIVTSNAVSSNISVLLGRGDGTFLPTRVYPILGTTGLAGVPFALAMGDFNGDGYPDILTGGVTNVVSMRNDGTGAFTSISSNSNGGPVSSSAKVADLNSDGIPDAVVTTWAGNAQVLLGNGDGTFRPGDNLSSGGLVAEAFSIGDLNGDGIPDLAIATTTSTGLVGTVGVLIGHGGGHFGHDAISANYPIDVALWATAIADFNGDGNADIVAVNSVPPSFSLFGATATGHSAPRSPLICSHNPQQPGSNEPSFRAIAVSPSRSRQPIPGTWPVLSGTRSRVSKLATIEYSCAR